MSAFCTAQAARLSAAIEQMRADASMGRSVNTAELDKIQQDYGVEVSRLRTGLAFYADIEDYLYGDAPILIDRGDTARAVLAAAPAFASQNGAVGAP